MASIKQALFTNWHVMRWLRLVIGIIAAIHAFHSQDNVSGVVAFFLIFQAITNTGCAGEKGCDLPTVNHKHK